MANKPTKQLPLSLKQGERDVRFSIVRGIGIVIVVFAHNAALGSRLTSIGSSFLMPMFFLLSGISFHYSASQATWRNFRRYLCASIVFPYAFFAIISIPFFEITVLGGGGEWPPLKYAIYSFFSGQFFSNGSLWFLMSLGICKLLFWTLLRIQEKTSLRVLLWCAVTFVCILLQMKFAFFALETNFMTLFNLPSIPSGLLFMSIGYALTPCYVWMRKTKLRRREALPISLICLYLLFKFSSTGLSYGMHIGFMRSLEVYVTALIGTVMCFMIATVIQGRGLHFLRNALVWIGCNSLLMFTIEDGVVGHLARELSFALTGMRRSWLTVIIALVLLPLAYRLIAPAYEWLKVRVFQRGSGN
jgi:fucose 4-O-acetylase-like acetyltransferase